MGEYSMITSYSDINSLFGSYLRQYVICGTRGTIYILRLGNTECSQVPFDICTGMFDTFDHNHLQNVLSFKRYLCCLRSLEHSLTDDFLKGRPKSVDDLENIDAVQKVIMQDRHVTFCEIKEILS